MDEVHERGIDMDQILLLLRNRLQQGDEQRLVFMSATAENDFLSGYLDCLKSGMAAHTMLRPCGIAI
jgi:HrpA-like RNA helicase